MKKIQSIFGTALMMSGLLALGACSNDDAFVPQFTDVPLQVEVAGVEGESRAIIEGTTLPNESSYGIFAFYGNSSERLAQNIKVNYTDGVSTLTQNVFLPENSDISVYAYYPYTANMTTEDYLQIESSSQIDYLYGYSANSDNQLTYVNEAQPKASIYFRHAMARVTLKIKKAADNENNYKLPYVGLMNVKQYGYLDIKGNTVLDCSGTEKLVAKPENYVLDAVDSEILVDFLVIPMNTAEQPVTLCIGDAIGGTIEDWLLSASIPNSTWTSGQQYTYTVTISKGGVLELSEAVITEWVNNEQPSIEIDENNFRGARIGDIYYSDDTYSTELNPSKTPIGVVFALTDKKGGDINRSLTESAHGRIVSLKDLSSGYYGGAYWTRTSFDIETLPNYSSAGEGTREINSLGQITQWPTDGALSDFDGYNNTLSIAEAVEITDGVDWEAWYQAISYETEGRTAGSWYLPAFGETTLIDLLYMNNIISPQKQPCFNRLYKPGYLYCMWSSTERDEKSAWAIYLGETYAIYKYGSDYFMEVRAVTTF